MSFGPYPLAIAEGGPYEIPRTVERVEYVKDGDSTFIVLHLKSETGGRSTSIRAPITREVYEAHTGA